MRQLSGLQKQVLGLYRQFLRTIQQKYVNNPETLKQMRFVVQQRFRDEASSIKKHDFQIIEHKLRQGQKTIKLIEMPGFEAANVIQKNRS